MPSSHLHASHRIARIVCYVVLAFSSAVFAIETLFLWQHNMFILGISNTTALSITFIVLGIILAAAIYLRRKEQQTGSASILYTFILGCTAIALAISTIAFLLGPFGIEIQFATIHTSLMFNPWLGFHLLLLALLALELVIARRKTNQPPLRTPQSARRTAIAATALWISAALAFALYIHHSLGTPRAVQYLAGYALEESLSVDNLLVFLLLFRLFHIDPSRQPKVLFWGVAGAILMRGLFIAGGIKLLARFEWITYVFALILLVAAIRVALPEKPGDQLMEPRWIAWLKQWHPISTRQDHFIVIEDRRPTATILLLALIAIELTDVIFAIDSIPAVLSITRHPFLAYTSNIMAVMGLRSLYFLLIGMLTRLRYLHLGLAVILAFAAFKMLASRWVEVGPLPSLAVILAVLTVTIAASLLASKPEMTTPVS